ncbi:MAG TPA: glutamate--cysteine ligase [Candidatus Binataceae bacterium]|nr:glutamate--cysteine ligase [Candidatus Binataceae bacterium]
MSDEIRSKEELLEYFQGGSKPREQWRIGTEYEKVVVDARSGRAIPFSGPRGVEEILKRLADRYGYEPDDEEGRIIALKGPASSITLEPGGQIELSGEQCPDIHCAHREFTRHVEELLEVSRDLGVAILALGMQPVSKLADIELLPKARYHIMFPYMARKGRLGQRMMKQTAGVQANLDYSDEADAMHKLRLSFALTPLIYAIFGNSPLTDGDLKGYLTYRAHIWTDTDPDRCGIPPFIFNEGAGFEDYMDYALDVPMYFLIRDHHYIDLTQPPGLSFRQYMERGHGRERATLEDWSNHLTTIFTEVRLKKYVEIRSADSQPPAMMLALPALCKGILYDSDCSLAAWDLVKRWSYPERLKLGDLASKIGLEAPVGRLKLKDLAVELMQIAMSGLARQRALNERGEDEGIYLARLFDQVRGGYNHANLVVSRWKGAWNYDIRRLIAAISYEAEGVI